MSHIDLGRAGHAGDCLPAPPRPAAIRSVPARAPRLHRPLLRLRLLNGGQQVGEPRARVLLIVLEGRRSGQPRRRANAPAARACPSAPRGGGADAAAAHVCVCAAWPRAPHRRLGRRAARRAAAGACAAPQTRPPARQRTRSGGRNARPAPASSAGHLDGAAELTARNVGGATRQRRLGRARVLLPGALAPARHRLCCARHRLEFPRTRFFF